MIHKVVVIGNSHAHSFTGSRLSNFGKGQRSTKLLSSYSLGPVSAKTFLTSKWKIAEHFLSQIQNPSSTLVLLSLGENDCRWYIPREADNLQMKFDEFAAEIVVNEYLSSMFEVMEKVQSLGFQIAGWAGHPTPDLPNDPDRVIYGPYGYRSKLTALWDHGLSVYCQENEYLFLSPIANILNEYGLPDKSKYVDEWHLDPAWLSAYLISKLEKEGRIRRGSLRVYQSQLITKKIHLVFLKLARVSKNLFFK
jgi:hypothetical protein